MQRGIKTRDGLRSRHAPDIEEGLKQHDDNDEGDDDSVSLEDHHGHGNKLGRPSSRFCEMVTQCIPNAPIRQAMNRCEQRCCLSASHQQRILRLSGSTTTCCQILYNLLPARVIGSPQVVPIGSSRMAPTSMKTPDTDEETPDDWPTGSSVAVPQSPRLPDFSKSRAQLPEYGPIQIEFCGDESSDIDDYEDHASITEEDLLLSSQGTPSGEKITFSLRLPKTKRKENVRNPPVRTFSNNSRSSLQAMVRSGSRSSMRGLRRSNSKESKDDRQNTAAVAMEMLGVNNKSKSSKLSALAQRRKRSGSMDTAETSTTTTRKVFIAPFPRPLSRENSMEHLHDHLHDDKSANNTPSQRSRSLRTKDLYAFMLNSPKNNNGPSDSASCADFSQEITMQLNDMNTSDQDMSRGTSMNSDDEVDADLKARRKLRMARRSSFVKGSKIERFDTNDNQCRARRALQRREAVKNAESYAEWKLDLLANG